MPALLAYSAYILVGLLLMVAFLVLYERVTPYRELGLIRQGNLAAALSYGGALLGFTLTVASSAIHSQGLLSFVEWAGVSGVIQLLTFSLVSVFIRDIKSHIENGNTAVGALMCFASLSVGALNAAALS